MTRRMVQILVVLTMAALCVIVVAFDRGYILTFQHKMLESEVSHTHQWSIWEPGQQRNDGTFLQFRHCTNCGLGEMRKVQEVK